ncbi:hypothetical protein [Candidatus Rhabdochlamydia porcellionis]|jgi:hypothetical protein|uniref:Uncharacterized protein n=1 Tax=Candidatus Rhabdochlamydia porcellionis TaxID=225148 RepID=A0ABX8YZ65_9BACT|nr:hypothetical protein [Candidatus Rhabdochlamydia porcellionis]QZA58609.1 hypothetical protein RHAB15C_0000486 [Candidatus Rhabdochlamydia porcellionis]
MNTYGLCSINMDTFNLKWHTDYVYPRQVRNAVVTLLKVHNLTLNILGYIPGVSVVSGCLRMGTGLLIYAVAWAVGERDAMRGVIIAHWYDECLLTGITQIGRGVLEAFVPFGWIANASLDAIATVWNIGKELYNASVCIGCMEYINQGPYPEPNYPLPFLLLHLV